MCVNSSSSSLEVPSLRGCRISGHAGMLDKVKGRAVVPVRVRDVVVGVEVARTGVRTIVHVTASTHAADLMGVNEVRRKTYGQ